MYTHAMSAFPLRQHQGSTFSQAQTIPSSWFRYKRIDSYPRPVFCFHFFKKIHYACWWRSIDDNGRMVIFHQFPQTWILFFQTVSRCLQVFWAPTLFVSSRASQRWPWKKLLLPRCVDPSAWEKTSRRCAMVILWDPSCWWIDGILMLSALGGEVSHGCFNVFIFQGFSTQN